MATISLQQAHTPRECGQCTAFKKLTQGFEKNVIDIAINGDPNFTCGLLEQYTQDVRALDLSIG